MFASVQTRPRVRWDIGSMASSSIASSSVWRLTVADMLVRRLECSIEHARLVAAVIQPQLGLVPPVQAIGILCADSALLGAVRKHVSKVPQ